MTRSVSAVSAFAAFLLSVTSSAALPTNLVSVAGMDISVHFPDIAIDASRKEIMLQDAARYFAQTLRLDQGGETETNLVAIRQAAMVARNENFENGFRFVINAGETNMVVSGTLANQYVSFPDWALRTNLLAKADEFVSCLRSDPLAVSNELFRRVFLLVIAFSPCVSGRIL